MPRSPSSPAFWRSPLRGPWFTSVLGVVLLVGITVMFVTGLLSYAAYNPNLAPVNDKTPDKGILGFYLFSWPTHPVWLYRLTQGVHVTLGITLIPVLLAKLWSVVPKLFALPPARSLAHALERLSLLLLVGGALFEFVTGVLNIQLDYIFPGSFYTLHFYGAWVFIAAFVTHAVLRVPTALRNLRGMRGRGPWPGSPDAPDGPDARDAQAVPDPSGAAAGRPGPAPGGPGGSAAPGGSGVRGEPGAGDAGGGRDTDGPGAVPGRPAPARRARRPPGPARPAPPVDQHPRTPARRGVRLPRPDRSGPSPAARVRSPVPRRPGPGPGTPSPVPRRPGPAPVSGTVGPRTVPTGAVPPRGRRTGRPARPAAGTGHRTARTRRGCPPAAHPPVPRTS